MNKQACWLCVNEGTFKNAGKCYFCKNSRTSPLPDNFQAKPIDEMIEILRKEIDRLEDMKNGLPEIAPCIHCGKEHMLIINSFQDSRYRVCGTLDTEESPACSSSGPSCDTEKEAILAWDRQNKIDTTKEDDVDKNINKKIYFIERVSDGVHWSGGEEGWGGRKAMLYYEDELYKFSIPDHYGGYMVNGHVFWRNREGSVVAKAVEIEY